jgi:hypothetical protein
LVWDRLELAVRIAGWDSRWTLDAVQRRPVGGLWTWDFCGWQSSVVNGLSHPADASRDPANNILGMPPTGPPTYPRIT